MTFAANGGVSVSRVSPGGSAAGTAVTAVTTGGGGEGGRETAGAQSNDPGLVTWEEEARLLLAGDGALPAPARTGLRGRGGAAATVWGRVTRGRATRARVRSGARSRPKRNPQPPHWPLETVVGEAGKLFLENDVINHVKPCRKGGRGEGRDLVRFQGLFSGVFSGFTRLCGKKLSSFEFSPP